MPNEKWSLLAGRNQAPLTEKDIRRAINTFMGLDKNVNARYEPDGRTVFSVSQEENGEEFGEIIFGPDIYPGRSVVDPNSALGLQAAAAHELTHYHRWKNKIALSDESMEHIEEALTSLHAILLYERHLYEQDIRQLISDAIQRLQIYIQNMGRPD